MKIIIKNKQSSIPQYPGYIELPPLKQGDPKFQERELAWIMEKGIAHYKQKPTTTEQGDRSCACNESFPLPCVHGFSTLIGWHVGSGKTAGALQAELRIKHFLKQEGDPRADWPTLIITPNSVKWQWAAIELAKWRSDLDVGEVIVIDGDSSDREMQMKFATNLSPKLIICTYSHFSPTTVGVFDWLQEWKWGMVICDEVTAIKNPRSARSLRIDGLQRAIALGLSATPQSGWPDKLWNPIKFIEPGPMEDREPEPCTPDKNKCPLPDWRRGQYRDGCNGCFNHMSEANICKVGGSKPAPTAGIKYHHHAHPYWKGFDSFKKLFCILEGYGQSSRVTGSRNEEQLNSQLRERGILSRITAKEVYGERNIPIVKILLEMEKEQFTIYDQIRSGIIRYLDKDSNERVKDTSSILALLTHLRRATTLTPAEFMQAQGDNPIENATLNPALASVDKGAKQSWLLEFLEENIQNTGNKIIVGSEWTDCLRGLAPKLERAGFAQARIKADVQGLTVSMSDLGEESEYFAMIHGGVASKERLAIQETFNQDPRLKVLMVTQAGYQGMNLRGCGTEKDTVYVTALGVPWLPDQLFQLFGRADRFDQKSQLQVLLPAIVNSIDEKLHSVLYGKALSAEKAVEGNLDDDTIARKLSLHDAKSIRDLI